MDTLNRGRNNSFDLDRERLRSLRNPLPLFLIPRKFYPLPNHVLRMGLIEYKMKN